MSGISENYNKILTEIEQKISNPEERKFVKNKVSELMLMFMDIIDKISDVTEMEINNIEERQKELKLKIENISNKVSRIEDDIYDEDDENFELEIVCPYCNNEFVADLDDDDNVKNEVECPECHNIIELDWNEDDDDDGCSGFCGGCHGCGEDHYDEDDYLEQDDEQDNEQDNLDDDEDM